jgi:hypothetical protein
MLMVVFFFVCFFAWPGFSTNEIVSPTECQIQRGKFSLHLSAHIDFCGVGAEN